MMKVYELIGHTAVIDWGDRSQPTHMGLFKTAAAAEARKADWQSTPNWEMDWDRFDIVEHEVQE